MINYPKINIYVYDRYFCSTTWHKTLHNAIKSIYLKYPEYGKVTAQFAESKKKIKKHYYNTPLPQKYCICRLCLQN